MPDTTTVHWVCQTYPDRVKALLDSLDLARPGLEKVRAAAESGDLEQASIALLDYYRTGTSGRWLRTEPVKSSAARHEAGDAILNDTFTFYEQTDRVPRRSDGGWDWTYAGPTGDRQWAMALNRHFHIVTLLEAYRATGNAAYAARLDEHIRDWVVDSLPYPAKANANLYWGGLEISFRAKAWTKAFYGLQDCPQFTPAGRLLMLTSLPEHADHLRRFHRPNNNWTTMELSGLATLAAAFPEFKGSAEWLKYSGDTLADQLEHQIYPDGAQHELTSSYHHVALRNFELFADLCRDADLPLPKSYRAGIEKLWNYLAWSMRPDGFGPLNNDSDLTSYRAGVTKAAEVFKRPDWIYIASNGKDGQKPDRGPSIIFPWAGQAVFRSGWDPEATWAFFDIGPWGAAHQHNDKLHLSLVAYGRDFLVDSGRFNYVSGEGSWRTSYAQASVSHNVVLIDGHGQSPGPKTTTQPTSEADYAVGGDLEFARSSCDHFDKLAGSASHRRVVVHLPSSIVLVADRIETDRPRRIEALWHWHPDCTVAIEGESVASTDAGKANLRLAPLAPFKWTIELVKGQKTPQIQGWYSPRYNEWMPATAAVISAQVEGNVAFAWVLVPAPGAAPQVTGEILSSTDEAIDLRVHVGSGEAMRVRIPWETSPPQFVSD